MDQNTLEGYRLSPQQAHLWLQHAQSVAQCLIRIDGPADAETLRRSVQQVVKRHDILRTSFESLPGMGLPLQVVGETETALCWTETELHVEGHDTLSRLMKGAANKLWSSSSGVVVGALFIKGSGRHYLCLTLPALCADRRTLHNISSEIASNYANGSAAKETTVQYVQFSEWQHQLLEEFEAGPDVADEQTEAPAKLTLPFDDWAKDSEEAGSEFVTFNVDDATTTAIEALCVQEEFTVEDFLLTCWQILLWRLTDEERVAVLKQFDGRKFPELQDCFGFIDSYFPVSLRCTRTMSFREAIRKVISANREVKQRQDYFTWRQTRVVQLQQTSEDAMPIGFVFEERREVIPAGPVAFSMHRLYSDCERFKMELAATRAGSSLALTFRYRSDLLDSAMSRRIGRAYLSLLADAAQDAEAAIGKLNIVADEERQCLLAECNATAAGYAFDSCLHEYFEVAVERTPDAVAVQFQQEQVSFGELNRSANQLAHYLRGKGVRPETRVALLLDRSIEMIVAVLAVLKAGGAYLPLDPASPEERLLYTLEDAQASFLITETPVSGYGGEVLSLDETREALGLECDENPINHTLPENLAYIIYTSGSTGKPKGVMIQHRSVVNLFHALNEAIYREHQPPLRVSVNAPLVFDASVKQLVQLLNGHTLCLIPEEVRPNGEELLALITAEHIDVLDCTPSQLKMLLEAGLINEPHISSRLTLIGGEAIDESVWELLVQSSTNTFYNVYGPTECTVDATVCHLTPEVNRPSIGRPIGNVQAVVCDWNGDPVVPGFSGELCLAGEGLARGYTGDPALTAARFIPNCLAKTPGARLYRTGDYARQWPEGNLAFLGRKDDQVKLRGLRIELGEIEAVLRKHPAVADACVVVQVDQTGNRRLVGYAVAKRKDAPAIDGYARYELGNGLAIAHQNRTDTTYLYQEIFEDEVYLRQGVQLPERACVFDVGANIGLFTIFVAERCPDARIYAFEPLAPIFDVLRVNSKLSGANTTLFPFGLSSVEKRETFTYYPLYPSRSGLTAYADSSEELDVIKKFLANKQQAGDTDMSVMLAEADDLFGGYFNGELFECRVRRLSDVIREEEIDRIDLLKIDVQRAELDVLEGIDEEDWEKIRQVVMEVHDASGTYTDGRVRKIVSLLEKHGFQTIAEQDPLLRNTDRHTVYAIRPQDAQSYNDTSSVHAGNGHGNGWKTSRVIDALDAHSNGHGPITAGALREFLSRKVPDYMIPAAFVFLDSFPLNRNGKINRQELLAPVSIADDETKPSRSLTQFEELLALIWTDVLGVTHVGPQDNFFQQGGHSLLATRLISRVRESFSIELPLRSVFESPTLAGLAWRVETAKQKTHESIPLTIAPAGRDRRLPLSFAQERLWFLNQLEPNSFVYNCPCALSLTGPFKPEVLEQTLTEIVRRHESLRTTFSQENGEPFQVIHPAEPVRLEVLDLSGSEDGEAKRRELIAAEALELFDLSNGPLFRVCALKLSEQDHVILFTTHHIISDGWSMGVLVREVAALYQAFSKGGPSPLSELHIQYADFAVWQREYLEGQVLDEQLSYWRDQLQGAPALLELPADRPRPAVQTYRGASQRVIVPSAVAEQLGKVCRSEGVTLFMLLLAAFKVLLYRYTGQTDIVVGTDIAGRDRQEVEGLVGFFINQLALRTQLRGDETFRDVLKREREICLEAFTHQAAPFERVVEELNPVRSLSHSPIFQVSFTLNNTPLESAELTGLEMRRLDSGSGIAKFDLTLTMAETGDHLGGAFEYNSDLFDAASIDRIATHFQSLLGGIVVDTETRVDELPLLCEAERTQFLSEWNDTRRDFSASPALLHGLFEAQAKRSPDAIAAVHGERSITYAELDHRANTLATRLRALGVGPERLAGVLLNSSIEMLVAILGVLKAGGGYMTLDPGYPRERLLYMLTDANVTILLTQEEIARTLYVETPRVPVLYVDSQTATEVDCTSDVVEVSPENVAYVLYTSGSTGQPKGVVVNHRAIVNYTLAMCDEFGLRDDDKILQLASPSFDVLLEEVFPALACGACVVFAEDRETLLSCAELSRTIDRHGITGCELPAPYWQELVAHLQRSHESAPPTLRLLLVGCERPSTQCIEQWMEWGHSLIYVFGITETTITSTLQRFNNENPGLRISIGRPVANTEAYVLDHRLEPVPIGVTAELFLGGDGVARGYLDRPELTAAKFVPHPFSDEPGARVYKSGDMARHLADGRIEFIGRVDEQVKISGYRIEPGEIQAAIKSYAGVLECFVDARRDESSGDARLVGYVVCEDEKQFDAANLRSYLREKLPDYMVPSYFVSLPMLPITANGKIDRYQLTAPDFQANVVSQSQLPVTPTEELVAEIFARVLRVNRVGRHQDFFELGGHSLLATQLVSRLQEAFAVELPLRSVFDTPNVVDLSRRIEAERSGGRSMQLPPLEVADRDRPMPLSFAQQRLWFIQQLEPESAAYNIPAAMRLSGPLNRRVLKQALTEIVRRHESLRTIFRHENGAAYQMVRPWEPFVLMMQDLTVFDGSEREERAAELAAAEARRPFDLAVGPLFRVRGLKLGKEEHIMLFTMHHIISDGWSMGVLVREIATLYNSLLRGETSPLAELAIQYNDYAVWQREYLAGEVLEEQLRYWREQLQGAPALLELPTDRPRPAVQTYRGASRSVIVPKDVTDGLRMLCREQGVTLFMLLSAAFKVLLYRYSGQRDIVIGTDIAGRNRPEIEGLVGFFVNQLALRTELRDSETFRELLRREREICLQAFTHQDAPFERVVEELNPVRSLSHTPLFQVSFSFDNRQFEDAQLTGLEVRPLASEATAKFDLTLTITEMGDHLRGALLYNVDLFDASSMDRFAAHFQTLLGSIVRGMETRVSELPLFSEMERMQLLTEWNNTDKDYSTRPVLLHGLFEEQARHSPDAIAAICGQRSITYAELDHRADAFAMRLRALGIGPERLVGVLLPGSIEMLTAILGILKTGGGFVPLDPQYPRERLLYMLKDACVSLLVTQEQIAQRLEIQLPEVTVLYTDSWTMTFALDQTAATCEVSPENTAYVIYTSGSTGQPKGVVVSHEAIANYTLAMCDELELQADDRILQFASPSFDVLLEELFPALASGASVIFVEDRERLLSCDEFSRVIAAHGITACELPTPYWHELVAHLSRSGQRPPASLRLLIVGGERPSADCVAQWAEWGHSWINVFGITETTITSTLQRFDSPADADATNSIGKPFANTEVYLLDQQFEPVPIGVTTELYLGGAGLARGYLNRPELTAEKFIPHPFSEDAGARLYKTGDCTRFLADGRIEFIGRVDNQLKIRGYRVEPAEIEAMLSLHPAVSENVVVAIADGGDDRRLIAYVATTGEAGEMSGELRSFLKERLPEYMIPSQFLFVERLPLTPNGKLDRSALPAPEANVVGATDKESFATPIQELLAALWSELLRVEHVGAEDDFFELGGHSLLATQLVSRVREAFGVELSLRSVFDVPTVRGMAHEIEAALRNNAGIVTKPLLPVKRTGPLPLSFAQQRLWFMQQLEPASAAYNVPLAMRISGPLNLPVLEEAFTEIVRRHESLRTIFPHENGAAYQLIQPAGPLALAVEDLSKFSSAERGDQAAELSAAEARRPFDVAVGPLFRVRVLKLADEEHILLFTMHHIISDAWSTSVLMREVATLYDSFSRGEASPLGALAIQYGDYAVWQRDSLKGEVLEEQLRYWREQLQGAPALLELVTDRTRPRVQSYRGASQRVMVSRELTAGLRELCREQGVTLFMLLLAAFKVLLYRYSGQTDITVGTPVAGRDRSELLGLVGFFANTLALRTRVTAEMSFRDLLKEVRQKSVDAYVHQDVPFEKLVEELAPERATAYTPLFQVMFAFEELPQTSLPLKDLQFTPLKTESETAKFDLTLVLTAAGPVINGTLEYSTDLFDDSTIERMLCHFQRLLLSIVSSPDSPLNALEMLSEEEVVLLNTPVAIADLEQSFAF